MTDKTIKTALQGLLFLVLLLDGCKKNDDQEKETPSIWEAFTGNPVISAGDHIAGSYWNDPSVLKTDTGYMMYLTTNLGEPGENVVPFLALSNDGVNWTIGNDPILTVGPNPDDFDHACVETPSVVFFNGKYHMYYTGVKTSIADPLSIGYATSTDGISWTKHTDGPVLTPTGNGTDWNGYQVGEPGAVVFDDKIYLFFTGLGQRASGTPQQKWSVGMAISEDGLTFTSPVKILEQGINFPALKGYGGYSTPCALLLNGHIHLFYDVVLADPDFVQVALTHSTSYDKAETWIEDDVPIFTRGSFSWTAREIRSPSVIHDNGKLKMWFAGDDWNRGLFAIGFASVSDTVYQAR